MMKQKLLKFYSFTEEMKKQGKEPKSKILSFKEKEADKKISKALSILEDSPIIKLQRWTCIGMEIIEYTISYVRGDRFEFEVELNEN